MAKNAGTAGEDIGRPGPWGEDRYQEAGQPAGVSVKTPPGSVPNADKRGSKPVAQREYTSAEAVPPPQDQPESS
jgi:hypothetical protein